MPFTEEEARAYFRSVANPDEGAVANAKESLLAFLGLDLRNIHDYSVRYGMIGAAARQAGGARLKEWFIKHVPAFADTAEGLPEYCAELPYLSSYYRVGFRAPSVPSASDPILANHLLNLALAGVKYPFSIPEFALWGGHLGVWVKDGFEPVFARSLNQREPELEGVVQELLAFRHPQGFLGEALLRGILSSTRTDLHQQVKELLLTAGRQEGLRQLICESADFGAPEAFRMILRTISEHGLLRFSSVQRAAVVWLQDPDEARPSLEKSLARLLELLEGDQPNWQDPYDLRLGLWVIAYRDANDALLMAESLWESQGEDGLQEILSVARTIGLPRRAILALQGLDHPSYKVASKALACLPYKLSGMEELGSEIALKIWPLLDRLKGREFAEDRSAAWARLLEACPDTDLDRVLSRLKEVDGESRSTLVLRIADSKAHTVQEKVRSLTSFLGDRDSSVRAYARKVLDLKVRTKEEAVALEVHLKKKANDIRSTMLDALLTQPDSLLAESIQRLLSSKSLDQRLGGLDLIRKVTLANRMREAAMALLQSRSASPIAITKEEEAVIAILQPKQEAGPALTLANGFGLLIGEKPLDRSWAPPNRSMPVVTPGTREILLSLEGFLEKNRSAEFVCTFTYGEETFEVAADRHIRLSYVARGQEGIVPGMALWQQWIEEAKPGQMGAGRLDLVRAFFVMTSWSGAWGYNTVDPFHLLPKEWREGIEPFTLRYMRVPHVALLAALLKEDHAGVLSDILDLLDEVLFRNIAVGKGKKLGELRDFWRHQVHPMMDHLWRFLHDAVTREFSRRRFDQDVYADHLGKAGKSPDSTLLGGIPPTGQSMEIALANGAITELEVLQCLVRNPFGGARSEHPIPRVQSVQRRLGTAAIDVELDRGESPVASTEVVCRVLLDPRLDQVLKLLDRNISLRTCFTDSSSTIAYAFSTILGSSRPPADLAPSAFASACRERGIHRDRLLELASLQPLWASHVEEALEAPGFAEAVWWIHAHCKESEWQSRGLREDTWESVVSEKSSVPRDHLKQGGVDIAWHQKVKALISPAHWDEVLRFAKFATDGTGYTRALLAASILDGRTGLDDLKKKIEKSRPPDAVRGIGLVPLDPARREEDIKERFLYLQEFMRQSRQFGAQRQASEKAAFGMAMGNLSRAAGYPDPLRMTWKLEAEEVEDLKPDGVSHEVEGVRVTLAFDPLGRPVVSGYKGGEELASLPAKVNKDPQVKALIDRRKALERQEQRSRRALEEAMVRGDRFLGRELRSLLDHPGLAPLFRGILWESERGRGFLSPDALSLIGLDGPLELGADDEARVVHPVALALDGSWPTWQEEVFRREIVQPFKQVFREIYVPTPAEREKYETTRWAGHQCKPRQAVGILNKRGWVSTFEEPPKKVIHSADVAAILEIVDYWGTPADMEGLELEALHFRKASSGEPLRLAEIDPAAFSEIMRDIDLIVSVANSLDVDPEPSESTAAMRGSLVRETARLLRLDNVSIEGRFAFIQGQLGRYSVHLGSGEARVNQKHLSIVAVRQPQRGRLFLPFVDDDPRSAEVVSKVILLSRDSEIRDPGIMEQIVGV